MQTIKIWIFTILLLCFYQQGNAQIVNWNSLDNTKHMINLGMGWDYSLSYNLGYAYRVNTNKPLTLNANFSIPSGETLWDDFKTKFGSQLVLLNKSNFKGSVTINGMYRRYENPLVRLQNFGGEIKGAFGYYRSRWFVAGEIGFDKAIVTNFKHSNTFKEGIFQEVKDGWYVPATGGNILYGVQTAYSFKKSDLTFSIGRATTQDFKTTPLIPYYFTLGFNYKIH